MFFGERGGGAEVGRRRFRQAAPDDGDAYVTVSIITSLGSLEYSEVRTLGLRAWRFVGGSGRGAFFAFTIR